MTPLRTPALAGRCSTVALVLVLTTGCAGVANAPSDPADSALTGSSSAAAPTPTPATETESATQTAVDSARSALAASLPDLAGRIQVLESGGGVATIKRDVASVTATARKALKQLRAAAFPSATRVCGTVRTQAAAIAEAAAQAQGAASGVASAVADENRARDAVKEQRDAVAADLEALKAALAGSADPAGTVTDVTQALAAADSALTSVAASVAADQDSIAADLATITDVASAARSTSAKAGC